MTRPRLRRDLVIIEQTYRGEQSYVVKDPETHKYFRFRPVEIVVMQELDGDKTPPDVAALLAEQGLPLTPAAVEAFAAKLRQLGLLERSLSERSVLLMERVRAERQRRLRKTHYEGSVLRMRWSVADPDRWLARWLPRLRFFFSRPFLLISVVLFGIYGVIAWAHWSELWHALAVFYTPSGYTLELIIVFWLTAMAVIVIHELGHGFACKHFGGQVHELGAMLIYFQPAFFCNVNDAWTFPDRSARLWVTAAGSWIQLVVAGIAAIVWWAAASGTLVSQVALVAMVIGGATTVLANANPLIPLDGYYALSDYLEIPNLRKRAFGHLAWLVKRHVLRLAVPQPPADARERKVFVIYGTLAFVYSATILLLIAGAVFGWVSRALGGLGVVAFALLLWTLLRRGLRDWGRAIVTAIREHRALWRSGGLWRRVGGAAAALVVLGLVVPWPITVTGRFTARAPLDLAVRAPESGVLAQMHVVEGERVPAGTLLGLVRNLALERRAVTLRRLADSLAGEETRARVAGRTAQARQFEAERREWDTERVAVEHRIRALTLRAPVAGVVVTPRLEERLGRWVAAGGEVMRLNEPDSLELVVALERAGATLVRAGQPAAVFVRLGVGRALEARVASVAAAAAGPGRVEARIHFPSAAAGLRPGVTGEARIAVQRSNVWGALWWAVRKRVRSDLLL